MGEIRDEEDPAAAWSALAGHAERHRSRGLGGFADRLAASGALSFGTGGRPVVLDTDVGGDPDDAVAVAVAARAVPDLALVVTADEFHGDGRARFARHLLDSLGRPDVPVVAGRDLGNTRYFCVEGLTSPAGRADDDVLAAVRRVCEQTEGRVRWVGMGPLSNLADVLTADPSLADVLEVTQMGSAVNYRNPDVAEHNVRLDPAAARRVLDLARSPSFVLSDVTFRPDTVMAVRADGPVYRHLAAAGTPWGHLLHAHLDRWYGRFYPETMMHDPLTLSAALRLPFVDFSSSCVWFEADGRMRLDDEGRQVFLSNRADYSAFARWMHRALGMTDAGAPDQAGLPQSST
jgi:inosine-uridine nucleoside N-ribohydrolase